MDDLPALTQPIDSLPTIPLDDSPEAIRTRIPALKARIDTDYIQLAKDLWFVYTKALYKEWNYETFDNYVISTGIPIDRANRLRRLWSKLVLQIGLTPSALKDVGYSHARLISTIATKSDAKEWAESAKTLSLRELQAKIDNAKPSAPASPPPTRVAEPQATLPPAPTPVKRTFYLFNEQNEIVSEAIAESARQSKSEKDGHNLSMIALAFLANKLTEFETPNKWLGFYMRHLERVFGGNLIHVTSPEAFEVLRKAIEANPHLFKKDSTHGGHDGEAQANAQAP